MQREQGQIEAIDFGGIHLFFDTFINSFSIFLVGTVYLALLILLVIIGIMLIFKKEAPNLFSSRQIVFPYI